MRKLTPAEEGIKIGDEEEALEAVAVQEVGGNDRGVEVHKAGKILGNQPQVADGAFVLPVLRQIKHLFEGAEAAQAVEEVKNAPVQ